MIYASVNNIKINDKAKSMADAIWSLAHVKMERVEPARFLDIKQTGAGTFDITLHGFHASDTDCGEIREYAKSIGVQVMNALRFKNELRVIVEVEGPDIIDLIGDAALLEQLAEECSELAQAALKMARKRRGTNPTPMTMEECKQRLTEETADVLLCIKELHSIIDCDKADEFMDIKRDRWEERIREKESKK